MNYHRKLTLEETLVDTENLPGFDTARFEGVLERPLATGVFLALGGIFLLVGGFLAARAGYLMLIKGEAYAMRAEDNRLVHQTIVPERGVIFDRAGVPLAYNVPGFRVVVDTRGAKKSVLVPRMEELARALNRDTAEVVTLVERHWEYGEIVIDLIREWSIANDIMTRFKDQDAVRVEPTPLRAYVAHPAFGHVVGYVGAVTEENITEDTAALGWGEVGKTGIERAYDAVLRGNPGVKIVETNSQGAVLSEGIYRREDRGENLTLSISAELQKKIYEVLEKTAQERGFGGGSAVLLDVRTGETLALVSYPGFDANVMSTGNPRDEVSRILSDESHPLFFRAIAGLYPPASTVKPFLAAAAIDEHVISPEKVIYTEGRIVVPNPFNPERPAIFKDWKNHGPVDMVHAIAVSSDAYFYTIGGGHNSIDGLGVDRMRDYFLRFGFGQTTGIDLLGEEEGLVPSKEWKARAYPDDPLWRVGDSYNMGIGQGWLLTTPLQMARATLALAREGELLRPHLVKSITHNDISALAPLPVSISKSALDVARKGMRLAVTEGTAMGVADIRLPVAAKTGTAEVGKSAWTHSWFIGFLPWEDPRLVLVVNMERGPAGNLIGATSVAHEILQWCFPQGLLTNNC
ncbi:MAG: penicillin-binding protein 2 [Candidatus Ryanbacteria bacterium RIFCSPLOWO2_02_FULL_45_11c]|uniref:Penicillin-binding protein 2 n=1 Tax=Candidatus Ryanbacteria bacterium RIFCSPLOWO2_02_FULL_45_11c TaxID=1802128 RepID=A0A1G2H368_9BACT|nr:MAG: penicillin-binding protein 2 [Candidatus Ryanbacteria bacterium RIFCSPLOWO2_02_FULL_45_11c]